MYLCMCIYIRMYLMIKFIKKKKGGGAHEKNNRFSINYMHHQDEFLSTKINEENTVAPVLF